MGKEDNLSTPNDYPSNNATNGKVKVVKCDFPIKENKLSNSISNFKMANNNEIFSYLTNKKNSNMPREAWSNSQSSNKVIG